MTLPAVKQRSGLPECRLCAAIACVAQQHMLLRSLDHCCVPAVGNAHEHAWLAGASAPDSLGG